jgi:hypothetical protein
VSEKKSYVLDSFAVLAYLVTGDPEFKKVHDLDVKWLGS